MTTTYFEEGSADVPAPVRARQNAIAACRTMLEELGFDCVSEGVVRTPERMVDALAELSEGMFLDPARHLKVTFENPGGQPDLILVRSIPFTSLCEHHILPFSGTATIGYVMSPGARIPGLSKLARVTAEFAARPQVQERLGTQILEAITSSLDVQGAGVVISSMHCCMTLRGARAQGAVMVTRHLSGVLNEDPMRGQFLAEARAAR